jgi:hypothetical protein
MISLLSLNCSLHSCPNFGEYLKERMLLGDFGWVLTGRRKEKKKVDLKKIAYPDQVSNALK